MTVAQDIELEFDKLADQFCRFMLKTNPVGASSIGFHDHDEELTDFSPSGLTKKCDRLEFFKVAFKAIPKKSLDTARSVDLNLIQSKIETELIWAKKHQVHTLVPDYYLNDILFGVYFVVTREFASNRDRAISATRRLAQVPNILKHARKNIEQPSKVFVQSAISTCEGAIVFFNDAIPNFSQSIRGSLREALLEVNEDAIAELKSFALFLEEELLPKSKGQFAVGKQVYNQLLNYHCQLKVKHEDLVKIARKEIKQIEAEINIVAGKIEKNRSWKDIVEKLKESTPTVQGLVGIYKREMKRAKSFVESNGLVTIPEGEEIDIMPTPAFALPMIPFAAYLASGPMDQNQKGTFWVSVPTGVPGKEAKKRMKAHPKAGIPIIALHETYPGHHLQMVIGNSNEDLIRHLTRSPLTIEGWAFYCEEMMWEQGFYSDPAQRLLQLKDALFRAYRVLIDVGLHTKTLSPEKAMAMLVDQVGLETLDAEREVLRYCQEPCQPMSFLIGKVEIMKLLNDVKAKQGKAFSLKDFHDEFLSYGPIPIASVRELMEL